MKKIFFIFFLIFFLPFISSVNISMKTEFNSQETLIAKVSGDFLQPILNENIFFYRGHVRVPIEYDLAKINDSVYIYAILPKTENKKNYSIAIENVRHIENGQSTDEEIKKNFSISEQIADFNINPGFVMAKDDFFIELKNLQNSEIEIKIETEQSGGFFSSLFGGSDEQIVLNPGETKKIDFNIVNFESGLQIIKLSTDNLTYEVPVYIFLNPQDSIDGKKDEKNQDEETQNIEKPTENKKEEPSPQAIKTCFEMKGEICSQNEICVGEFEYALDEKCCLGTCKEKPKTPPWKIFGWGIIILVILILIVLFAKYKGTKKPFDLLNIAMRR